MMYEPDQHDENVLIMLKLMYERNENDDNDV